MPSLTPMVLKIKPTRSCCPDAFFYDLGEVIEVHVAGVAVVAHADDADLCFGEVFVCESDAV
jgi:hypothetical protein